ncbi:hypothetical protein [Tessaracoccus coleopterorum]|uniref:hypothetical protein n=1 Tax=Tessaracoccus coleopterorum TaxID=2714950 RepID=UPI0018D407AC|nr:hypothetical protein [Tessaracoccus coleopterorum]
MTGQHITTRRSLLTAAGLGVLAVPGIAHAAPGTRASGRCRSARRPTPSSTRSSPPTATPEVGGWAPTAPTPCG